jgi:hypothetical protein
MDDLRDALCTAEVQAVLVNADGEMRLGPLIEAHSMWLAHCSNDRERIAQDEYLDQPSS